MRQARTSAPTFYCLKGFLTVRPKMTSLINKLPAKLDISQLNAARVLQRLKLRDRQHVVYGIMTDRWPMAKYTIVCLVLSGLIPVAVRLNLPHGMYCMLSNSLLMTEIKSWYIPFIDASAIIKHPAENEANFNLMVPTLGAL